MSEALYKSSWWHINLLVGLYCVTTVTIVFSVFYIVSVLLGMIHLKWEKTVLWILMSLSLGGSHRHLLFTLHIYLNCLYSVVSSCDRSWGQSQTLNPLSSQTTARLVSRQQQGETSSLGYVLSGCVCGGCCSLNTRFCGFGLSLSTKYCSYSTSWHCNQSWIVWQKITLLMLCWHLCKV